MTFFILSTIMSDTTEQKNPLVGIVHFCNECMVTTFFDIFCFVLFNDIFIIKIETSYYHNDETGI